MSRSYSTFRSLGIVDLHFHGAFGIDLMRATAPEMDSLSEQLWTQGVAAFCPTTLSVNASDLLQTVSRLGSWIHSTRARPGSNAPRFALPLGIHLEGPFIHPHACGAHPPGVIRKVTLPELNALWQASQGTLKILTLAPETLTPGELKKIVSWCQARKIVASLGHSRATEEEANRAFESGLTGVTHAWNALNFHHRAAGVLGAALGRKEVYLELIVDGAHVSPTVIRWTRQLHPAKKICLVSDCVPAAQTRPGSWHAFGPLRIQLKEGACRLPDGGLAGGGVLLPRSYARWLAGEARETGQSLQKLFRETIGSVTRAPLHALGLSPRLLQSHQVEWKIASDGDLTVSPRKLKAARTASST